VISTGARVGGGVGGGSLAWPAESGEPSSRPGDELLPPRIVIERATTTSSLCDQFKRLLMVPDPQVLKLVISAQVITSPVNNSMKTKPDNHWVLILTRNALIQGDLIARTFKIGSEFLFVS